MSDLASRARDAKARRDTCLGDLRRATLPLAQALETVPDALRTTSLWAVLLATHNLGDAGAKRICREAKVWPFMPLGELTKHQRDRIIEALPKRVTDV